MDRKKEALALQSWIVQHFDLWMRILKQGKSVLSEREFEQVAQEFQKLGFQCAFIVLISVYWEYAAPLAQKRLWEIWEVMRGMEEEDET